MNYQQPPPFPSQFPPPPPRPPVPPPSSLVKPGMILAVLAGGGVLVVGGIILVVALALSGSKSRKSPPASPSRSSSATTTAPTVTSRQSGKSATSKRTFQVGDQIEASWAAGWYPGTITEIGAGDRAGWYMVRFDDPNRGESWQEQYRIRPKGRDLSTPYTLKVEDTYGTWSLSAVNTNTYIEGDTEYRETNAYSNLGTLTINSNGTYEWVLSQTETLTGYWTREPEPRQYKGPVIIEKGPSGYKYWIHYNGRNDWGEEMIYIGSDAGIRYYAGRVGE